MKTLRFYIYIISSSLIALILNGCGYRAIFETVLDPVPVRTGNVITIKKVPPTIPTASTLVINWFGTSSYELSMGDISVLTDPFVTYKYPDKVISISRFPSKMTSDYREVLNRYGRIDPPTAIFIGHSHYDHMMDTVTALKMVNWNDIPVYGSPTTKHILAGYPKNISSGDTGTQPLKKWSENWHLSDTNAGWKEIQPNFLSYQSFKATHASHLFGITLWDGKHTEDLPEPPSITKDFLTGETYIHFFKFETLSGNKDEAFIVGLVGAATEVDDKLEDDLENFVASNKKNDDDTAVDVLILCVPGWDNIKKNEYPKNLLRILKPRIILLTHYDNFFNEDRDDDPTRLVPTAKFNEFLNKIQRNIDNIEDYGNFESILIPGVGTKLYLNKQPSGTINVSKLFR